MYALAAMIVGAGPSTSPRKLRGLMAQPKYLYLCRQVVYMPCTKVDKSVSSYRK